MLKVGDSHMRTSNIRWKLSISNDNNNIEERCRNAGVILDYL